MQRSPPRWRGRATAAAIAPLALLVATGLMWQTTSALFSTTAGSAGNSMAAAQVSLTDDDAGAALFALTGLQRGATEARCVVVTYGGTISAPVKLYASSSSGTLAPHITLTVEQGTGGSFGSCSGFSADTTLYSGTLGAFASTSTSWGTGVGDWTPTAAAQARTFRLTSTVSASAPATAQDSTADVTFTWEARST